MGTPLEDYRKMWQPQSGTGTLASLPATMRAKILAAHDLRRCHWSTDDNGHNRHGPCDCPTHTKAGDGGACKHSGGKAPDPRGGYRCASTEDVVSGLNLPADAQELLAAVLSLDWLQFNFSATDKTDSATLHLMYQNLTHTAAVGDAEQVSHFDPKEAVPFILQWQMAELPTPAGPCDEFECDCWDHKQHRLEQEKMDLYRRRDWLVGPSASAAQQWAQFQASEDKLSEGVAIFVDAVKAVGELLEGEVFPAMLEVGKIVNEYLKISKDPEQPAAVQVVSSMMALGVAKLKLAIDRRYYELCAAAGTCCPMSATPTPSPTPSIATPPATPTPSLETPSTTTGTTERPPGTPGSSPTPTPGSSPTPTPGGTPPPVPEKAEKGRMG